MTSFIPILLKGKLYPVKVGGKTKDEPAIKLSKDQEREIEKAFITGDVKLQKKYEDLILKTAIQDIQTAYMVWIKKEFAHLVPFDTKELVFVKPDGEKIIVPVWSVKKYGKPPEKPTKTSAKAAWFGSKQGDMLMPFKKIKVGKPGDLENNKSTLWGMLESGIKLFDTFTLKGSKRKIETTVTRNKARPSDKLDIDQLYVYINTFKPFFNKIQTLFKENKEWLAKQPIDIRSPTELESDICFEFLMKHSPAFREDYKKKQRMKGVYLFLYDGGFTTKDLEKFLDDHLKEKKKNQVPVTFTRKVTSRKPTVLGMSGEVNIPRKKEKNESVTGDPILEEQIISAIDNPKQELLSDEKNKELFKYFGEGNVGIPRTEMPQLEIEDELSDRRGSTSRKFLDFLISNNVKIIDNYVNVHDLKPTQKEIYRKSVIPKLGTLKAIEGKMDDFNRKELPAIKKDLDKIKDIDALKTKYKEEFDAKIFTGNIKLETAKKKLMKHLTEKYLNYLLKMVAPIIVSKDYHIIDGHHRWAALVAWDFKDRIDIPIMIHVKVVDMDTKALVDVANKFLKF